MPYTKLPGTNSFYALDLNTKKEMTKFPIFLYITETFQDLIISQVYKLWKHVNAPMIKIIESLIEKA